MTIETLHTDPKHYAQDPTDERMLSIIEKHINGGTPVEIANEIGIGPERIRQLLSQTNNSVEMAVAHRRARTSDSTRTAPQHLYVKKRPLDRLYSDQEMLDAVKAAHEAQSEQSEKDDFTLTNPLYTAYRSQGENSDIASAAALIQRFGSWREVLLAANLPAPAARRQYARKWSLEHVEALLDKYIAEHWPQPSYADFSDWLRWLDDEPSGMAVRNILSPMSWDEAVQASAKRCGFDYSQRRVARNPAQAKKRDLINKVAAENENIASVKELADETKLSISALSNMLSEENKEAFVIRRALRVQRSREAKRENAAA